jgi:hypothetical protein
LFFFNFLFCLLLNFISTIIRIFLSLVIFCKLSGLEFLQWLWFAS